MKKEKKYRDNLLKVLLTADELTTVEKKIAGTACRNTSDYIRNVLLEKPVLTWYRSQSLDEFLPIAGAIEDKLGAIERNFTRIIKVLRDHPPHPELTATLTFLLNEEFSLRGELRDIKSLLLKLYENARQDQDLRRDA
ncbi:MAG TPA: hypothetical protein VHW43_09035 [Puia sp.]|nr:hypothetical protein [Puia sp.]